MRLNAAVRYRLNPLVSLKPFDGGGNIQSFSAALGDRTFLLNQTATEMLQRFRTPTLLTDVLTSPADAERWDQSFAKLFLDTGLLLNEDKEPQLEDRKNRPSPSAQYLYWKTRLVPAGFVNILSSKLSVFFRTSFAIPMLSIIFMMHAVLLMQHGIGASKLFATLSTGQWVGTIICVYASLMVHEFGHASACAHYGQNRGPIGIALYGIYPVFYSDVTRAWRLRRWERVTVDLGGVYFQLIFGSTMLLCWWSLGYIACLACSYSILASTVLNLNPFLRFDGYWILADALGVPRPLDEGWFALKNCFRRCLGRPVPSPKLAAQYAPWVRVVLAVHAILTSLFIIWTIYFIVSIEIPHLWHVERGFLSALCEFRHLGKAPGEPIRSFSPYVGSTLTTVALASGLAMSLRTFVRQRLFGKGPLG